MGWLVLLWCVIGERWCLCMLLGVLCVCIEIFFVFFVCFLCVVSVLCEWCVLCGVVCVRHQAFRCILSHTLFGKSS